MTKKEERERILRKLLMEQEFQEKRVQLMIKYGDLTALLNDGCSLNEVSQLMNINKDTIAKSIKTLERYKILIRTPDKKWKLISRNIGSGVALQGTLFNDEFYDELEEGLDNFDPVTGRIFDLLVEGPVSLTDMVKTLDVDKVIVTRKLKLMQKDRLIIKTPDKKYKLLASITEY